MASDHKMEGRALYIQWSKKAPVRWLPLDQDPKGEMEPSRIAELPEVLVSQRARAKNLRIH